MPATAVGRAKGRSTIASSNRLPGNSIAHQHPGHQQPEHHAHRGGGGAGAEGEFGGGETRGEPERFQPFVASPAPAALMNKAASGMRMIRLR